MRIAFDHQCFFDQSQGGITRYYIELINGLRQQRGVTALGWAGLHCSKAQVPFPGRRLPVWMVQTKGIRRLLHQNASSRFERWAKSIRADIYHPTYYDDLAGPDGAKRVITVYDCIHERYFASRGFDKITTRRKQRQLELADHILCISQQTKDDVCKFYGLPSTRATVVHLGVRPFAESMPIQPSPRPYFLFVGRRSSYKNYSIVQSAWRMDERLRRTFDLVCAGGPVLSREELVDGATIRHVNFPGDRELARLYTEAAALIYPSRFEGFGLPLLEAMISGCPVVTTRGGAIPEVAADAAEYFDMDSSEDLVRALSAVTERSERRDYLIVRGRERAAMFTWERTVKLTLDVYREILFNGPPSGDKQSNC